MPLTDEERKDVDAACLRLMGYEPVKWDGEIWHSIPPGGIGIRHSGSCLSPSEALWCVAPLVEALRARGWEMGEIQWDVRGYRVTLERRTGPDVRGGWHERMEEAVTVAAARAMEEEE